MRNGIQYRDIINTWYGNEVRLRGDVRENCFKIPSDEIEGGTFENQTHDANVEFERCLRGEKACND